MIAVRDSSCWLFSWVLRQWFLLFTWKRVWLRWACLIIFGFFLRWWFMAVSSISILHGSLLLFFLVSNFHLKWFICSTRMNSNSAVELLWLECELVRVFCIMQVAGSEQKLSDPVVVSALDHHIEVRLMQLPTVVQPLVPVIRQVSSYVKEFDARVVSLRGCFYCAFWLALGLLLLLRLLLRL